jgi:hypothetical protein
MKNKPISIFFKKTLAPINLKSSVNKKTFNLSTISAPNISLNHPKKPMPEPNHLET